MNRRTKKLTRQLGRGLRGVGLMGCLLAVGSCGNSLVNEGRAATFMTIELLDAASGADPTSFRQFLESDVVTNVTAMLNGQEVRVPTIYGDIGRVNMRLGFKDPGSSANPASPTRNNYITVNRYRVVFKRSDGRNTEGVDVPYAFEGGLTFTVLELGAATFPLVRVQAKLEPPLLTMRGAGGAIAVSTIAEVTFYGHDQTGATTSATGFISVNFADWGDPE